MANSKSNIINSWNETKNEFQARYAHFAKRYAKTGSQNDLGHMHECSYTLITVFGLTHHQVLELEKNGCAGYTDAQREDICNEGGNDDESESV